MSTDDAWILALASWRLADGRVIPPADSTIESMLRRIEEEKLIGVLAGAVGAGDVVARGDTRAAVADLHRRAMGEVLHLEEMLLLAVDTLAADGIDCRVLKGSAMAHLVHPDPSQRSFGDNDLLVAPDDMERAVGALTAAGAERSHPQLSRTFDRKFTKSITMRWLQHTEIDLHRTLAPGPFGLLIDLDDLRAEPATFEIAGRNLSTLPPHAQLLNAALHVALGDLVPRLGNLRDLALLCQMPTVDVSRVIDTATRWHCQAPLAKGIKSAAALGAPLGELQTWAYEHHADAADARRLQCYESVDARFRHQAMASLRVLPNWSDRFAYAAAVARNPLRRLTGSRYAQ